MYIYINKLWNVEYYQNPGNAMRCKTGQDRSKRGGTQARRFPIILANIEYLKWFQHIQIHALGRLYALLAFTMGISFRHTFKVFRVNCDNVLLSISYAFPFLEIRPFTLWCKGSHLTSNAISNSNHTAMYSGYLYTHPALLHGILCLSTMGWGALGITPAQ